MKEGIRKKENPYCNNNDPNSDFKYIFFILKDHKKTINRAKHLLILTNMSSLVP